MQASGKRKGGEKMILGVYNYKGKRKKGSTYNLNNIADFYNKEIACFYCNSEEMLERDHVQPLYRKGIDELENLQILCNLCHNQKTKEERDPDNMLQFIKNHKEAYLNDS